MSKKTLSVYVSQATWVAPARTGTTAPLAGAHADLASMDWPALGQALRESSGPVRVQLVLSARLCRFQVLPWVSSIHSGKAIRSYVADAFAEAAVTAQSHHLQIDWPAYGEPILAIAYPRMPVEAARAALQSHGHAVASVDSSVGLILHKYARQLDADPVLLAYAEDDGITGITIEAGRVAQVESLSGLQGGLDDVRVWCSRKQFAFADDKQLRWLPTAAKPEAFVGVALAGVEVDPFSAGHAVVAAWR